MWTPQQLRQYRDRGLLAQPGLLSAGEVRELCEVTDRYLTRYSGPGPSSGDDETRMHYVKEKSGAVRTLFGLHRGQPSYRAAIRHPKIAGPLKQIFDNDAYVYHSKVNVKDAFEGGVWLWHQDYGYWQHDGVDDRLASVMIMLDDTTIHGGCLLFVPGSHRWGVLDHYSDEVTTNYKQWCVRPEALRQRLTGGCEIVAATGKPGDVWFFDCNILHGSGHNMAPQSRRTLIYACANIDNKPKPVTNPRPDWVVDREFEPVTAQVPVATGGIALQT